MMYLLEIFMPLQSITEEVVASGHICVPEWVVGGVGAVFTGMATAIRVLWKSANTRADKTIQHLEEDLEREEKRHAG